MRKIWPLFVVLLLAKGVFAQADIAALEASLKGKQKALRSYSADSVLRYRWVDGNLQLEPIQARTVGIFTLDEIKIKKTTLIFKGKRATLVRDAAKNNQLIAVTPTPMSIEIDYGTEDPAKTFPALEGLLFFYTFDQAIATLPENVARYLPYTLNEATVNPVRDCDCISFFSNAHWSEVKAQDMVAPKFVSASDIDTSNYSRQDGKKSTTKLEFYISETGKISDIWLLKPGGYGLDDAAEKNMAHYVYKPAMYLGRPVGVMLSIDVEVTAVATP